MDPDNIVDSIYSNIYKDNYKHNQVYQEELIKCLKHINNISSSNITSTEYILFHHRLEKILDEHIVVTCKIVKYLKKRGFRVVRIESDNQMILHINWKKFKLRHKDVDHARKYLRKITK